MQDRLGLGKLPHLGGILPLRGAGIVRDLIAGATLAALAIPEVMGYTRIAGTPVVTGLYTLLLPAVLFALFGSSRHLVVGADSATAAIMAAALTHLAVPASAEWMQLAGALALFCAVLLFVARLARLGFLADFLSRTVLVGFLTGVGVQVALGELGGVLGLASQGNGTLEKLWNTALQLPHLKAPDALVAFGVMLLIVSFRLVVPKFPAALLAVVLAILASWGLDLQGHGVGILGAVGGGLPGVHWPQMGEVLQHRRQLASTAVAMSVVILAQSAATSRAYAWKYGEKVSEAADLTALALANAGAALTGAFVVNGSPTKTQMVDSAGGRSQLAHLAMAAIVLLVLVFLTGPIAYLPRAALSGIVLLIGVDLIHVKDLRTIHSSRRSEFWVATATAAAVVVFGVEIAVVLAMLASLIDHVRRGYRPHNSLLVRGPDGHAMLVAIDAGLEYQPGLIVYRFNHSMYYANVDVLSQEVKALVSHAAPGLRWLVLDLDAVDDVDFTAGEALVELGKSLQARGVALKFMRVAAPVLAQLHRYAAVPHDVQVFTSVRDMRHSYENDRAASAH